MVKSYIPALLLVVFGFLSYFFNSFGFLLVAISVLSLVVFVVACIVRYLKKSASVNWIKVPLMLVTVCAVAAPVNFMRPYAPPVIQSTNVSNDLMYSFETDQEDRKTIKTYLPYFRLQIRERDSIRTEQVKQLYRENRITKPLDKFHAAFILHHSRESKLYEAAHKLAAEAASAQELENSLQVQWLAKATYDRWMISLGKPQKYATQNSLTITAQ